jgi:phenylacetate-CoA ligase
MDAGQLLGISGLLASMRINQWKSGEELERMQSERLLDAVACACRDVPHYREALAGRRIRDIDDFRSLPITQKGDIRKNPDSFISSRFQKKSLVRMQTSGSSGMPLEVYHSRAESAYGPAFEVHQMLEAGVGPLDTHAVLTRARQSSGLLARLGLFRRCPVEFRNARQAAMDIKAIHPDVIRGAPSFLIPIARENISCGLGLRARSVFTFSETLPASGRALVERSFGCRVFDSYGSIETSWISWECSEGGMHLFSDHLFAEVVDRKGAPLPPGKTGSLVLTPLWQRAMPFIRYNLSDRTAILGKCRCGRGYPLIRPVEGRSNDYIFLPGGSLCSAHVISFNIRSFPGIVQFQSIQEKSLEIALYVVPGHEFPPDGKQRLVKILRSALPEPMDVRVETVDALPGGQSGKLCDFVSRVRQKD